MTGLAKSRGVDQVDARILKTRRTLHTALVALMAEKSFDGVTIQEIAARAGIGYATFFRHYPSREALLAEIADGLIGDLLVVVAPLMLERNTAAAAQMLVRFVDERRPLCYGLLVGAGDAMRRDITRRAIALAGGADRVAPTWLPRDLGIVHGVAASLTILGWWLEHDPRRDSASIAAMIDRLVFAPISG